MIDVIVHCLAKTVNSVTGKTTSFKSELVLRSSKVVDKLFFENVFEKLRYNWEYCYTPVIVYVGMASLSTFL